MDIRELAAWLRSPGRPDWSACIGLDGFIDRVYRVVDRRLDSRRVSFVPTLDEYGERLKKAAGMSLNIELIPRSVKLGGNGPIMAQALARLGADVTCWGALGYPEPAAEFAPLGALAGLCSFAEPAHTDVYEFDDGKIIASVLEELNALSWESIIERTGRRRLRTLLALSRLIALNNWTMLPCMTEVWLGLQREVLPELPRAERLFFLDLADPAKRTREDLAAALSCAAGFSDFGDVLLSCNRSEAVRVAAALGFGAEGAGDAELCAEIAARTGFRWVSVHTRTGAAMAGGGEAFSAGGFFTEKPHISVGGGDHFNAGLAFGLLGGLPPEAALLLGGAVSGSYVRSGRSPDAEELAAFLESRARSQRQ